MNSSLDRSLDDLMMTGNSGSGRGRGRGLRTTATKRVMMDVDTPETGPIRRQRLSTTVRQSNAPYNNFLSRTSGTSGSFGSVGRRGVGDSQFWSRGAGAASGGGSLLDRLGPKAAVGTKVHISNLKYDVTDSNELSELFGTVGEVLGATVHFDRTGRSTGEAEVIFAKQSDAVKAVEKFHTRTLDNVPMNVKLAGRDGIENPLNPHSEDVMEEDSPAISRQRITQVPSLPGKGSNVRAGLFGTALGRGGRDDYDDVGHQNGEAYVGGGGRRGGGRGRDVSFSVTIDEVSEFADRGGGRRGGRGGGGFRGGARGRGPARGRAGRGDGGHADKQTVSAQDLDAELEAYTKQRNS